jgi:hypothetical protein
VHTGVRGGRVTDKYRTLPQANFKTLVNKNEIKPEIGDSPGNFPSKPRPPLGILAKTSGTPSPGFSTRVHLSMPVIVTILQMIFN